MLIHIVTFAVGLIIAFGLQQMVESWQRRRRVRKMREASRHPDQD